MKDNYNIKVNPPELSSEQIKQHQNFDALLASFEKTPAASESESNTAGEAAKSSASNWKIVSMTPAKRRRLKYTASAIITLVAASLLFTVLRQPLEEVEVYQAPTLQIEELLALQSPLPTLAQPAETKIVKAEEGETLTYASGSKVTIPASAFVDKQGAPVKGEVEITYREFNDPVDMFLAGIPQELNKHQDLQSTGMMEIKGFQDGEPIFLSSNKKLNIELQGKMAVGTSSEELGVYAYSRQEDTWNYTNKDQVEILNAPTNPNNPTITNGETNTLSNPTDNTLAPIIAQLQEEKKESKPVPPIRPGVPNGMQVFDFDIDFKNAPELTKYHQKIDFMAAAEVFPPATFDTIWSDMQLTKNAQGAYVLTLEYEDERGMVTRRTSEVEPVVVATEAAKEQFRTEKARYRKDLDAWEQEIVALAQTQLTTTETLVNIINRFEIDRFGLWNCGKPIQWANEQTIPTQFVDAAGAPIALQEVFVAAQRQQFYYSAPSEENGSQVPLPNKEQLEQKIWAMSAEGELLVAERGTSDMSNEHVLLMRPVSVPPSAADLRELLTL